MNQQFSVDYFIDNFQMYIEQNEHDHTPIDAMNRYYRSVVSTLLLDHLTKNAEIVKRLRNLDAAYEHVKQTL